MRPMLASNPHSYPSPLCAQLLPCLQSSCTLVHLQPTMILMIDGCGSRPTLKTSHVTLDRCETGWFATKLPTNFSDRLERRRRGALFWEETFMTTLATTRSWNVNGLLEEADRWHFSQLFRWLLFANRDPRRDVLEDDLARRSAAHLPPG